MTEKARCAYSCIGFYFNLRWFAKPLAVRNMLRGFSDFEIIKSPIDGCFQTNTVEDAR